MFFETDVAVNGYAIGIGINGNQVGLDVIAGCSFSRKIETDSGTAGHPCCHSLTPTCPRKMFLASRLEVGGPGIVARFNFLWDWLAAKYCSVPKV